MIRTWLAWALAVGVTGLHAQSTLSLDKLATLDYTPSVQVEDYTGTLDNPDRWALMLPDWLVALEGQTVEVRGFMYPLDFEQGTTKKFLFLPFDLTCHFGDFPKIHEFLIVEMSTGGVRPELHIPVTLIGELDIREEWESGMTTGLLFLDGKRVRY